LYAKIPQNSSLYYLLAQKGTRNQLNKCSYICFTLERGQLIGELISVTERLNSKYTEIRDASCYGVGVPFCVCALVGVVAEMVMLHAALFLKTMSFRGNGATLTQ
jgi:hypothetical protein